MVLFLHNRYRTTGGEERVVEDLLRLVREQLEEPAELLTRDSAQAGRVQAARGLLGGGSNPEEVTATLRLAGARVLHAHNLHPTFGWRALAAAREQGARVVLHLHQYRLVCATGVCFTRNAPCTRCHGRNTLPGVLLNCRGNRAESVTYGLALALWQRRMIQHADAVIVPSEFARQRLHELGAALPDDRVHVLAPPVRIAASFQRRMVEGAPERSRIVETGPGRSSGEYALVVSRLSPEKGVDVAIEACRLAGMPLVIAGEGPEESSLRAQTHGDEVSFVGRVEDERLADLRAGAAIALVPSRSAETFGMAAAEAMAAGLPVAASHVGALPELVDPAGLVPASDANALAAAIKRLLDDTGARARALERVGAMCAPEIVARRLAEVYDASGQ
jgi:glycosyltransferase involved in cell wall biosynthesis